MRRVLVLLLAAVVIAAVLAPRLAAVGAEVLPGAVRTIVICVGDTLQTIAVDAEGRPVELEETGPCTPGPTPTGASSPLVGCRRLARALPRRPRTAPRLRPRTPRHLRPPGRAPPASV
jgi:hypothetical protein